MVVNRNPPFAARVNRVVHGVLGRVNFSWCHDKRTATRLWHRLVRSSEPHGRVRHIGREPDEHFVAHTHEDGFLGMTKFGQKRGLWVDSVVDLDLVCCAVNGLLGFHIFQSELYDVVEIDLDKPFTVYVVGVGMRVSWRSERAEGSVESEKLNDSFEYRLHWQQRYSSRPFTASIYSPFQPETTTSDVKIADESHKDLVLLGADHLGYHRTTEFA